MHIELQSMGFSVTEGLRAHTERRVRFALGWAEADLRRLAVSLSDINGPRGGKDKRCKIHVRLAGAKEVLVEDTEDDLYLAIDRAVERAEHAVARRLQRRREVCHERLAPPQPEVDDGAEPGL